MWSQIGILRNAFSGTLGIEGPVLSFPEHFLHMGPMPSHISRLCSFLSLFGLSTPVSILISMSQIIFAEISLLEVDTVVPAEVSSARLKLFLLLISGLLVLSISQAICSSYTISIFLSITSVVS